MLETYVLHITKECNMNCTYCYEQDKSSTYTWEELKNLLNDIVELNKNFNLEFLGGEPCLRIDLIEQVVTYLENNDEVNVESYTITTNGTIINDTLISLLQNYPKIRWIASIDGNKFMNFMRTTREGKNSYDIVVKNFQELNKALNNDARRQLGVHFTTHHYNIGYLNDGVKDLYDKGFRGFGIGTVESIMVIDDQYCDEFMKQCRELSDRIHAGEFTGIEIGCFVSVKPPTDERHYIRDASGKIILETYGRAKGDIKDSEEYKTSPSGSSISDKINFIRYAAYKYHNRKK